MYVYAGATACANSRWLGWSNAAKLEMDRVMQLGNAHTGNGTGNGGIRERHVGSSVAGWSEMMYTCTSLPRRVPTKTRGNAAPLEERGSGRHVATHCALAAEMATYCSGRWMATGGRGQA